MVHIELSSRGRDTIALEMPDISYFSTNRSGGLEENCWEAENKLLTYRISDFRCRDFNVTRYQIYCKEDCCMRSLNVWDFLLFVRGSSNAFCRRHGISGFGGKGIRI